MAVLKGPAGLWLLFLCVDIAVLSCTALLHAPLTTKLSSIHTGVQVIIPSYRFKQVGIVDIISVRVVGPSSPLAIQIWRPTVDGGYHLHWYVTFMENPLTVYRVSSEVNYQDQIGVPVREGDVLGFHILPSPKPISVVYYQDVELDGGEGEGEVYYLEEVGNPICELSLCNASVKVAVGGLPSIQTHVVTSDQSSESVEYERANLSPSIKCVENPPILCTHHPLFDDSSQASTPEPDAAAPDMATSLESTTAATVATPTVATSTVATPTVATPTVATPTVATPTVATPTVATPTVATPTVATPSTTKTGVNPPSIDLELPSTIAPVGDEEPSVHLISPRDMESAAESEEEVTTANPDDELVLSTAAIAFIAVGGVFFVALVVLVFVLLACLFPRNSVKKTFVPTAMEAVADSSDTNLVASSSGEHSNGSNTANPGQGNHTGVHSHQHPATSNHEEQNHRRTDSCRHTTASSHHDYNNAIPHHVSATSNHVYANAEVSHVGDFRPFSPLYVNSDDGSMRELLSERGSHQGSRSREGRGWSVGSSHRDRIHGNMSREGRDWSVGSQKDRVVGYHARDGRGFSAGPPHVDRVQESQTQHKRGWSVGSARLERVNSQHSKEKKNWFSKRKEKLQSPQAGDDKQQASTEAHGPQEQFLRLGRARSVSAAMKYKVDHSATELPRPKSDSSNLSTVLSKPLPLPPFSVPPPTPLLSRSNPQLTRRLVPPPTHSPPLPRETLFPPQNKSIMEVSGDYTAPVPVAERYKYDPKLRQEMGEISSMQEPLFFDRSHDYSDPDEPDDEVKASGKYDHLSSHEPDIHPERHAQAFSDLEGLTDDNIPPAIYTRGYVPTEEQRRMMHLHYEGHYEIADELETDTVNGYDRLNYFKETDIYWTPAATAEDLYTQLSENKYREIERTDVNILNSIGAGHFGTVRKGVWFNGTTSINVAIKTVKTSSELERVKLLQEAAIMGQFANKYVVGLLGVVTMGQPVLVILEYMQKGDLHSFLRKLHPKMSDRGLPDIVPTMFVKFSKDIANGMSYLAKKCFIHRDLAARNVLLNDELTCKIGDFGMARDIESEGHYYKSHGGIIPVKWTAPEALHYNKYSSASDVWSYGMVLFEIWSLGEKPFTDLSNPIVIALVSSKHCQPPPPGCPRPIYHLMVECWNPDHSQRPSFDSIHDYLDSSKDSLLQWQNRDVLPDKMAHLLGSPLEEANNLYLDLQRTYQKPLIM